MSRLTIDDEGTVRLWADDGQLVDAVTLDTRNGRSVHMWTPRCKHPALTVSGVCRLCHQQVMIEESLAGFDDDEELDTPDDGDDERGGMTVLVVGLTVCCIAVVVVIGWILGGAR